MARVDWKAVAAERRRLRVLRDNAPRAGAPDVTVNLPPRRESAVPTLAAVAQPQHEPAPEPPKPVTPAPVEPLSRTCIACAHHHYRKCTSVSARGSATSPFLDAQEARRGRCGKEGKFWAPLVLRKWKARGPVIGDPNPYIPPVPFRRLERFEDGVVAVLYKPAQLPAPRPFLIWREYHTKQQSREGGGQP